MRADYGRLYCDAPACDADLHEVQNVRLSAADSVESLRPLCTILALVDNSWLAILADQGDYLIYWGWSLSIFSQDHDPARSVIAVDSSHFRGGKGQNVSGWPFMAATTGVGRIGLPPRPWGHAWINHLQHVSPSPAAARSRAEAR